ncbi:hypothetical protein M0804_008212 [Polistes exclamans]|nr:hypothetical protein M0804_008212 [Polistes exclamans]
MKLILGWYPKIFKLVDGFIKEMCYLLYREKWGNIDLIDAVIIDGVNVLKLVIVVYDQELLRVITGERDIIFLSHF